MAAGEHVVHSARWSLAVFLIHAGVPFEKMMEIFASSSDYNERTTRYQLQYVKDKNYSMPSCNTMESNGIALAECPCLSANADFRRGRPIDYAKKKKIVESKKVVK
jgi:DNA primase large subunit